MGWESSDVARFDLWLLLQGQTRIAKCKSAYNLLIIGPRCLQCETNLYRGGQQFTGDSDSPISIVPHLKLTSVLILKVPYSIEKCATCLDTFLRF